MRLSDWLLFGNLALWTGLLVTPFQWKNPALNGVFLALALLSQLVWVYYGQIKPQIDELTP